MGRLRRFHGSEESAELHVGEQQQARDGETTPTTRVSDVLQIVANTGPTASMNVRTPAATSPSDFSDEKL